MGVSSSDEAAHSRSVTPLLPRITEYVRIDAGLSSDFVVSFIFENWVRRCFHCSREKSSKPVEDRPEEDDVGCDPERVSDTEVDRKAVQSGLHCQHLGVSLKQLNTRS